MVSKVCWNVELYPSVSFSTIHQKFMLAVSSKFCASEILSNISVKGPQLIVSITKSIIGIG